MQYSIEIRPLATIEILDAFDWYQTQQDGLGVDFLQELDAFYEILYQNPLTFSYFDEPIRQGKINRFPYLVVYEVFGNIIVIYSVFMYQQHPDKKRLK